MSNHENNPATKTHIACVGDSITELTNYPNYLSQRIGENYVVKNFGVCGSTVSFDSESPYRYTSAYRDVALFQPDIVLIMLGTNDAAIDLEGHRGTFSQDYQTLIRNFQSLPSKPKIWIVLPPPVFSEILGINADAFNNEVIPAIKQTSKKADLPLIDVFSALQSPRFFFDGVHPNEGGAKIIAEVIHQALFAN